MIIKTDDPDIGFFLEVDLKYADNIKEKTKIFPFCPGKKSFLKINIMILWKWKNLKNVQNLKSYYVIGLIKRII